jgi:hypothetical protein
VILPSIGALETIRVEGVALQILFRNAELQLAVPVAKHHDVLDREVALTEFD